MYRRIRVLAMLLTLAAGAGLISAAEPTEGVVTDESPVATAAVLFIGDCHALFLDRYFPQLAASGDPPIVVDPGTAAHGGWPLEILWSTGSYFYPDLRSLVEGSGKWDFVVIGAGYSPDEPEVRKFSDWVPKFDERSREAGAQTVLVVPWPRQQDINSVQDRAVVADDVAAQLGARVAPVALAIARVMHERPDLLQYVDDLHVNAAGWYLEMCVLYATLFDRSPEGLTYRLDDVPADSPEARLWVLPASWALSDEEAGYLQQVAWVTVQEYQKQ